MSEFKAPLDDILASLAHIAGDLTAWDADLARQIGEAFADFAEGEIAPLDERGDQQGCALVDGRVRMPDGFGDVYKAWCAQGWPGLTVPADFGGLGLSPLMLALTSEIFTGACHSLQMVTGLVPGAVRTLLDYGTPAQQQRWLPDFASGERLATMCLTEAGAGSDLSRVRCRAIPDGDTWRISGEKIFISGGDQDMSAGIFHLVLARTSDDGIKGLSLFACDSHLADGSRNAVAVERIEEKCGLHASPTCQVVFDNAEAELLGEVGQGMRGMFTMMNHARVDVGLQGVAHAARATDIARRHTAERVQGRGTDGKPVTLEQHPDVIRQLDSMDAIAVGCRLLAHRVGALLDSEGDRALIDFLTPMLKVYATESGIRAADTGIQLLGGYGYLREYRVEQTWRDARITAIYEGASAIHGLANATRGRTTGGADAFGQWVADRSKGDVAGETMLAHWCAAGEALAADPLEGASDWLSLGAGLWCWLEWRDFAAAHPDDARYQRLWARADRNLRADNLRSAALLGIV